MPEITTMTLRQYMLAQLRAAMRWARTQGLPSATKAERTLILGRWIDDGHAAKWRTKNPKTPEWKFCTASPDFPFGVDIREEGENHDLGYGFQVIRSVWDARFRAGILKRFRDAGKGWLGNPVAAIYYRGARAFGWIWWRLAGLNY